MSRKRVFIFDEGADPRPRMLGLKDATAIEARLLTLPVSSVELAVLYMSALIEQPGTTSIGLKLSLDRPTVSRALHRLEAIGAIVVIRHGRTDVAVKTTDLGRDLLRMGLEAVQAKDCDSLREKEASGYPGGSNAQPLRTSS